jgi:curved DNA-binding protein CbpA
MLPKQDYYTLLGVARDASQEEIKRAYFEAAQKLHPDKNTAAGETELFLGVQQAYEVLSNPTRRKQYDATLPPEEKQFLPYTHRIIYSRPNLVHLDEPQMIYFILELGAPDAARASPSPPLNVCLVLDRSTSAGRKNGYRQSDRCPGAAQSQAAGYLERGHVQRSGGCHHPCILSAG